MKNRQLLLFGPATTGVEMTLSSACNQRQTDNTRVSEMRYIAGSARSLPRLDIEFCAERSVATWTESNHVGER